jgi:hypothetical protein
LPIRQNCSRDGAGASCVNNKTDIAVNDHCISIRNSEVGVVPFTNQVTARGGIRSISPIAKEL